jgi:hypothetical protein
MPYYFLNFKLEDTFKNFIKSVAAPDCTVLTSFEVITAGEEITEPWVGVRCMSSRNGAADVQLDYTDSTRYMTVDVAIRTHAEDILNTDKSVQKTARAYHGDIVGQIMDAFFCSTIKDDLNAAAETIGNLVISAIDPPEMVTTVEDRSIVTVCKFEVLCSPKL